MISRLSKAIDLNTKPGRKRATVLQAAGGYVNTGIVIVQGLLLIPLYLYYIGAHTYGLWLASGGILGMLSLMNFGISSLVIQRISHAYAQENFDQTGLYFINAAVIYLGICLLFGAAGWLASYWIPAILNITGNDAELLHMCFQMAVLAMIIGIFNEYLRSFSGALLRPVIPAVSMAIGRVSGIAVTIWMLVNDFGLWSIPVGLVISEGVILSVNLMYALALYQKLEVNMRLDREIIKDYLLTSPALLMARVGNTVSKESQPLLITILINPEMTTAYMVTRRAADVVFQLLNVIVGSIMGSFSHLAGSGDSDRIINVAKKLLILSFSLSAIGFATYVGVNHAFVSLWVGESFVLDQGIILFIALGFFARTVRGLLGQLLYGLRNFIYPSKVVFLEAFFGVGLAIALLRVIGVIGVPIAFALSCVVAVVILGLRLRTELGVSICYSAISRFLISGIVLFGGGVSMGQIEIDSWFGFVLNLILVMAGAMVIFILMNLSRCREIYRSIAA